MNTKAFIEWSVDSLGDDIGIFSFNNETFKITISKEIINSYKICLIDYAILINNQWIFNVKKNNEQNFRLISIILNGFKQKALSCDYICFIVKNSERSKISLFKRIVSKMFENNYLMKQGNYTIFIASNKQIPLSLKIKSNLLLMISKKK